MPIDIASGRVELDREDFSLPGRVPITWTRSYRTTLLEERSSLIGLGWTTSWSSTLKRQGKQWIFCDREGAPHTFDDPNGSLLNGKTFRLPGDYLELSLRGGELTVLHWDVDTSEIERFVFASQSSHVEFHLIAIENVSGDRVELQWSPKGKLERLVQLAEKRSISVSYLPGGNIGSLKLDQAEREGILVRYEYDTKGRLEAVFNAREFAHRYEYDEQSRLRLEILPDGAVYTYRYDDQGRCIHFTGLDRYNEKKLRFLDPIGTSVLTNSYGATKTFKALASGQITSAASPLGARSGTVYDEFGRIVQMIDELGNSTTYRYDSMGNRDSITDPLGNVTRFQFNEHHQAISMIDASGQMWRREYDGNQRLIATINPLGARWSVDYDYEGHPLEIIEPMGFTRRQRYKDGMLVESTDFQANKTTFRWDAFGRLSQRTGPIGDRSRFFYDAAGNLTQVNQADGGTLRATYDAGDNLSSFTNAKGQSTRFRYGTCHRLLERTDPIGRSVRYQWGSEPDRLEAVINEKGETFTYTRDVEGRVIAERSFDGRLHQFAYDVAGRCVAFVNGNEERIVYKHDPLDRLIEQSLPTGEKTNFEFDPIGRILSAINPDAEVAFEYDAAGRLIRETQNAHWVATEYNASGEVIRTETSLGHEVVYELDPNGRMVKLTTAGDQSLSFERDARGLEVARNMPGEFRLEQTYDAMGRLTEQRVGRSRFAPSSLGRVVQGSQIASTSETIRRQYTYDQDGWLTKVRDGRWGMTEYGYDPAERLLSVLREQGVSENFEYDATDNLTHIRESNGHITDIALLYAPGNRIERRADTTYEFDPDGRLVKKTEKATTSTPVTWHYRWDALGQLRGLTRPDGEEWTYCYDSLCRRTSKSSSKSAECEYVWNGNVLAHDVQDSTATQTYVHALHSLKLLATLSDGEMLFITCDPIDTPVEVSNKEGQIVWNGRLHAWGSHQDDLPPSHSGDPHSRFSGQWFDEESSLHYNRFRYYDPSTARYISGDPIALRGGINLYAYVNNPMGWVDPLGLTGDPAKATHITYTGVKPDANGVPKPYIGYASMPGLNRTQQEVLNYRYPDKSGFVVPPQPFFVGNGQEGKNTARGLEQRLFERSGGLAGTSNLRNPVGEGNGNRDPYLKAADEELAKRDKGCSD